MTRSTSRTVLDDLDLNDVLDRFMDRVADEVANRIERRLDEWMAARQPRTGLDMRETAERLGLSQRTVRHLVKSDQIASIRVGRRVVIPASAIERFIQSGGQFGGQFSDGGGQRGA